MAFGDIINDPTVDQVTSTGASLTLNFASTATSGNLLILCYEGYDTVDLSGDGYTTAVTLDDTGNAEGAIYYKISDGTETSITVDDAVWGGTMVLLYEVEGPWDASPLDDSAGEVEAAADSTTTSPGSITTTYADTFIVLWAYNNSNSTSTATTVGSSYTIDETNIQHGSGFGIAAHKVLTSTGSENPTITWPISLKGVSAHAAFKGTGGGGGGLSIPVAQHHYLRG